jgi:hypothetical protein
MTVSNTLRFLLKKYSSGGDPHPTREEHNAMIDAVENNAVMGAQGITDARPAAGKGLRFFWDETVKRMWFDDGSNWNDLNPNGGGGAGTTIAPGVAAVEGSSVRAARADHTHLLPLATASAHGAMAASDKAKLDGAASSATPSTLAVRDASGRLSVGTPTDPAHATTKAYTDGLSTANADYTDQQVGPGLTARSWPLGAAAGYVVSGKIISVPFANKTHVTGTIKLAKANGATPATIAGGGDKAFVSLGAIIPAEIREASQPGIDAVRMLHGGAAAAAIQTIVEPSSGRVMVRANDAGGLTWGSNAEMSLNFSYYVETVVV